VCSPELVSVVELALDARRRSDGRFDPTVLPAMRAAGYDRTFRDVRRAPRPSTTPVPAGGGVHLDATTGIIALADGVALDLGGIAKGWIADRIAERLARVAPALVDAGGDIACTPRLENEPWSVDVAGSDLRIDLRDGGIATSGTDRRRWTDPATGDTRHHVIDPRTGAPTTSDLTRVTTIARSCVEAEAASTSLLVAGSTEALSIAAAFRVAWRAERPDGSVLASRELR
jgi:thiamine biosynthesis lipoprotein